MKGLVLSGGKGTRLRPLTYTGAKQLVPLANKPVLFYVIEDLVGAGVTDIGIVVGDTGEQIRAAVGDGRKFGAIVTYIQQGRAGGLAHAVQTARDFLGSERFVMYLGDNLIAGGISRYAEAFDDSTNTVHLLLKSVPNPRDFGVAEMENGRIVSLEEKPDNPKSNLALVGIYSFGPSVHRVTDAIVPSRRGELEITDAINYLIASGEIVKPHVVEGWWIDTGKMEDMLDANRLILEDIGRRIEGCVSSDSIVKGNVVVESGAQIEGSTLRGPLIIGEGALVENAYIGPFSAIGRDCIIRNSEVEHTIVMERSQILDVPRRIEDSVIGRDVVVTCSSGQPKAHKLVLGDHSRVGIL
jgi:glucose-1-phosphate thymidylyltransferase